MSRTKRAACNWWYRDRESYPWSYHFIEPVEQPRWKRTADKATYYRGECPSWCKTEAKRRYRSRDRQRISMGNWDFPSELIRPRHQATWDWW